CSRAPGNECNGGVDGAIVHRRKGWINSDPQTAAEVPPGGRYLQKSPSRAGEFTGRDARIAPGNSTAAKGFVPPVASASGRTFRFERSTKANEVNEGDAGGRTLLPHARSRLCLCAGTLHPGSPRPFLTATP